MICVDENMLPSDGSPFRPICKYDDAIDDTNETSTALRGNLEINMWSCPTYNHYSEEY